MIIELGCCYNNGEVCECADWKSFCLAHYSTWEYGLDACRRHCAKAPLCGKENPGLKLCDPYRGDAVNVSEWAGDIEPQCKCGKAVPQNASITTKKPAMG
jgi:hypothetical protein